MSKTKEVEEVKVEEVKVEEVEKIDKEEPISIEEDCEGFKEEEE